jgi:hypothetical protein
MAHRGGRGEGGGLTMPPRSCGIAPEGGASCPAAALLRRGCAPGVRLHPAPRARRLQPRAALALVMPPAAQGRPMMITHMIASYFADPTPRGRA